MEAAGTVAGLAAAMSAGVEVTASSAPDASHGCSGVHPDVPCLATVKAAATAGASRGPDSVRTVVDDLEVGCVSGDEREREEDEGEEGEGGRGRHV